MASIEHDHTKSRIKLWIMFVSVVLCVFNTFTRNDVEASLFGILARSSNQKGQNQKLFSDITSITSQAMRLNNRILGHHGF